MNIVTLIGRITKDPELRYIQGTGTAVSTINIAVDNYNSKTGEKGADFIPIVVYGKRAENLAQYMTKGSQIAIAEKISTRSYEKDGVKIYVTEVIANQVQFLSKINNNGQTQADNEFGTPSDEGDMPF